MTREVRLQGWRDAAARRLNSWRVASAADVARWKHGQSPYWDAVDARCRVSRTLGIRDPQERPAS